MTEGSAPVLCVISQPTFLPWLGWFDMMDQADVMVLLDDVQYEKRCWQQRNRLRTPKGLEFVTVPVKVKGRFEQRLHEAELDEGPWPAKLLRTVESNYRRAPFFEAHFDDFARCLSEAADRGRLAALNEALIMWLKARLGIQTPCVRASELAVGGRRGGHLALLCERVSATGYLSTPGSRDYLVEDADRFTERGITVWLHAYEHPTYRQRFEPFEPYASAADAVFNLGPEAGEIMRSGRRPSVPLAPVSDRDA